MSVRPREPAIASNAELEVASQGETVTSVAAAGGRVRLRAGSGGEVGGGSSSSGLLERDSERDVRLQNRSGDGIGEGSVVRLQASGRDPERVDREAAKTAGKWNGFACVRSSERTAGVRRERRERELPAVDIVEEPVVLVGKLAPNVLEFGFGRRLSNGREDGSREGRRVVRVGIRSSGGPVSDLVSGEFDRPLVPVMRSASVSSVASVAASGSTSRSAGRWSATRSRNAAAVTGSPDRSP